MKDKGNRNAKVFWPKNKLVIRFEVIKAKPPPLGLIRLCKLLSLGLSGINLVNGTMSLFVRKKLIRKFINTVNNICIISF